MLVHQINNNESSKNNLEEKIIKLEKRENTLNNKIRRANISCKAVLDSVSYYRTYGTYEEFNFDAEVGLEPTVIIPIHSYDVKELRKRMSEIRKEIDNVLDKYKSRYTTKANRTQYSLMVIALQAELQNVLYAMKYGKRDKAIENIQAIILKYQSVVGDGNKAIYNTIVRFIGEIESLFLDLVDTEYEYYTKREQEKEEQRALREQMRQEAAERKLLEQQQRKIEQEESKYHTEIDNTNKLLESETDQKKIEQLMRKIAELNTKLSKVEEKKEEIANLQNGKAGYIYIISNMGSFGETVFKVGMTRRLEPMDRVKELGDASVPFPFDVHSFIFSEDAPTLEKKLHTVLETTRVNKVNPRKEFFKVDLDKLEDVVNEVDPAAEFKKTILAQEYRKTLEIEKEMGLKS